MKIRLIGTFSYEDFKLVADFIETQQTTDREKESVIIDLDGNDIVVEVDRLGNIESITVGVREITKNYKIMLFGKLSTHKYNIVVANDLYKLYVDMFGIENVKLVYLGV